MPVEAFFLPMSQGQRGQRFCLLHRPVGTSIRGAVVYVHPFAEEMNKSRRMAALQSRALADAGFAVLQIDLLGCGDSSGDFGDATWQDWVADVVEASLWLGQQCPAPLWLWGLRAGCLIAVEAARTLDQPCHFLFWQAPSTGKPLLQKFLRLKVIGDMFDGQSKGVMDGLRQQLTSGSAIEIAGYHIGSALAAGLEAAVLMPPPHPGNVEWIELSARDDATLSHAAERSLKTWRDAGFEVTSRVAAGPAFWQTTEIEDAPALLETTTGMVLGTHRTHASLEHRITTAGSA